MAWRDAQALCDNVKQRIWQEHAKRGLPGRPYISVRVTQLYDTGVCLYFYFAFHCKGVRAPRDVFAELERAGRDEILRSGGSTCSAPATAEQEAAGYLGAARATTATSSVSVAPTHCRIAAPSFVRPAFPPRAAGAFARPQPR